MVKQKAAFERFFKSSFPPAAFMGAFVSFLGSAFGHMPKSGIDPKPKEPLVQIAVSESPKTGSTAPQRYELEYSNSAVLKVGNSSRILHHDLRGVSVDFSDNIYVLGDGKVIVFSPGGDNIGSWAAPNDAISLTVGPDQKIYFGLIGQVEIYSDSGTRTGGFSVGEGSRSATITDIKVHNGEVFIADASARLIRRYDKNSRQLGWIGSQGKIRTFMLPNRNLDIDIDPEGIIYATDPGRHRVSSWTLNGEMKGHFGKFGQMDPKDFVGCCNPVNLTLLPNGNIATAEKVSARIKVYGKQGKLLALIGPEHFNAKCTRLFLAADSKGRIIVADPINLSVKIFSALTKSGGGINT